MAEHSSQADDVGLRYARALFDLAVETEAGGALGVVEQDLRALKAALAESADLRRLLGSPVFSAEDKGKGLTAVAAKAGFHPLTGKFIGLLAQNGRTAALPSVITAFLAMAAKRRGTVQAVVTTAVPLTAEQQAGLSQSLRQSLGRDPEMEIRVDPAILGGLKVKVGSRLYDASLRSKLDQLKFALKRA